MPLRNMKPWELLAAAQHLAAQFPTADLVKNEVGNLAIVVDGDYLGYVDLRTGWLDLNPGDEAPGET